jgi:hypothetical protein
MATEPWTDMKIDIVRFRRNRNRVPLEYQAQLFGQHIAWHKDGTHVVASARTYEELVTWLGELGIALDEVVFDGIDDGGVELGWQGLVLGAEEFDGSWDASYPGT